MASNACPLVPNTGGISLNWSLVSNTIGFGHAISDGRPFWTGDLTGDAASDVFFYYPGDDNWWLGSYQPQVQQLNWSFAGNTSGFAGR